MESSSYLRYLSVGSSGVVLLCVCLMVCISTVVVYTYAGHRETRCGGRAGNDGKWRGLCSLLICEGSTGSIDDRAEEANQKLVHL